MSKSYKMFRPWMKLCAIPIVLGMALIPIHFALGYSLIVVFSVVVASLLLMEAVIELAEGR